MTEKRRHAVLLKNPEAGTFVPPREPNLLLDLDLTICASAKADNSPSLTKTAGSTCRAIASPNWKLLRPPYASDTTLRAVLYMGGRGRRSLLAAKGRCTTPDESVR